MSVATELRDIDVVIRVGVMILAGLRACSIRHIIKNEGDRSQYYSFNSPNHPHVLAQSDQRTTARDIGMGVI